MDTKHIAEKTAVVVKRMWHSPEVHAYINKESVGVVMSVDDFVRALVEQVFGDKTRLLMLTKSDAVVKALDAKDTILSEIKSATTHVV